jgi:Ca-activated chloride channel family protein
VVALATGLVAFAVPAAALDVLMRSPRPGTAAFGEVAIEAEVLSAEPIAEVVFRVDGRQVGRLTAPPWKLEVDVGSDNAGHLFEVVVRDAAGAEAMGRVETPPIRIDERVDLQLQQLYVTAHRPSGPDYPFARDEFRVLDDGAEQQVVTFERGDVPLTAALLVDTSSSMHGDRLRTALRGAEAFLYGLRQLDEAALTLFSDRRIYDTAFSRYPDEITRGLKGVAADGGTALNDHLYAALRRLEGRQGRRVAIVLSDGIDTDSALGADDVRWAAQRSRAMIYWIRLGGRDPGSFSSSWRSRKEHAAELSALEDTVAESGGRVVEVADLDAAEQAFGDILRELRSQYVLGYYPSRNRDDGAWHQVTVTVGRRGNPVRTRAGYFDF